MAVIEEHISIIVICIGLGIFIKSLRWIKNEFIPVLLMACGALLSLILYNADQLSFNHVVDAIAFGTFNGLISTGANQVYKQLQKFFDEKKGE